MRRFAISVVFLAIGLAVVPVFAQSAITTVSGAKNPIDVIWPQLVQRPEWLMKNTLDTCPFALFPSEERKLTLDWRTCDVVPGSCLEKCREGNGDLCYGLALTVQKTKGPFHEVSELLFARSCELGVSSGCTNRAAAMLELNAYDPDAVKCAADTFEKSCERNDAWGCTMFGSVLIEGLGRSKDTVRARTFLEKACAVSRESDACRKGKALAERIGTKR